MIANTIRELIQDGTFKKLLAAGVVSAKVKTQFEMFEKYRTRKITETIGEWDWDEIETIAIQYKVDSKTVWRAIKAMQQ